MEEQDVLGTLRRAHGRLAELAVDSTRRVLDGSADREAMEEAYAILALGGSAAAGVAALRRALAADGIDPETTGRIEGLYLNAFLDG